MNNDIIEIQNHPNFYLNNISIDHHYQYKMLSEKYIDQVTDLFTRAFCRSEPMTEYLKMDEKKYRIFAKSVTEKAYDDKLSVIALDGEKVVAIALIEDMALPGEIPDFDSKFIYIVSLLEKIGDPLFSNKKFQPNNIAHLFITAVDDEYRHQGLSKQVNFRAMDVAAQNGFHFIYSELTNYYNVKGIIPHLNIPTQLIGSCTYHDFIYKDIKPFADLIGRADAYLWAITKNPALKYHDATAHEENK